MNPARLDAEHVYVPSNLTVFCAWCRVRVPWSVPWSGSDPPLKRQAINGSGNPVALHGNETFWSSVIKRSGGRSVNSGITEREKSCGEIAQRTSILVNTNDHFNHHRVLVETCSGPTGWCTCIRGPRPMPAPLHPTPPFSPQPSPVRVPPLQNPPYPRPSKTPSSTNVAPPLREIFAKGCASPPTFWKAIILTAGRKLES